MNDVYKIMNNQDKVTMKHFYHIICAPNLDENLFAMRRIPWTFTGCVEQLYNPWLTNFDKPLKPRYDIEHETCKYSSILRG